MSLAVYRKAMELCRDFDVAPSLGGGEPTLHPKFDTILMEGIASPRDTWQQLGIITNGSITNRAKMLANLTGHKVIQAELSLDQYHDEIDAEVVEAFEKLGQRNTRDTSRQGTRDPLPWGRARELLGLDEDDGCWEHDESDCPCSSWMVKPNGDVYQCGCEDSPQIGNVYEGIHSPLSGECHHSNEFIQACLENDEEEAKTYGHLIGV